MMKKIFLLDDNVELIEITELILKKEFEVRSSSTPENISEEIAAFAPDLIIIDHFIGNSNSEMIVRQIHDAIPGFKTPFVLFSASHDIVEKAHHLGAAGYIEKPSSITHIKNYIRSLLQ